jgi:UDP-N-acetylmuramate dehydrogenase
MEDNWQLLLKKFGDQIKTEVLLKDHTTLHIGGKAKGYIEVQNEQSLEEIVRSCQELAIDYLVVGGGSNLLVSDEDLPLLIIKITFAGITKQEDIVTVKAGTVLQELVDFSIQSGCAGIHKMTGIPGTVGGAIYGNAGAYGQTISDHLVSVRVFTGKEIITLTKAECEFSYRDSAFKDNGFVIIDALFLFPKQSREELEMESTNVLKLRLAKYKPGIRCPGSFFKNVLSETLSSETRAKLPEYQDTFSKIPAWLFLNEVGAKGQKKGAIEIANFHSNLFMNEGEGKAQDFWDLAKEYHDKVKAKFGVDLEPEVQLINLPPLS